MPIAKIQGIAIFEQIALNMDRKHNKTDFSERWNNETPNSPRIFFHFD